MVAMGRVAPEVAKEHGLIPASRNEMLSELRSLFVDWEPWHQSFFMNHGCNFLVLAGMLPGYSYAKKFSSMFPGVARAPGRWLPVVLPVMVPAAVCGLTHDFYVTHDIFLQETPCTVCLETRATSLQVTLGAFLPFVSSVAGTLLLGHQMSLKWVPRTRSALFSFCKNTASKSAPLLAGWTVFQMIMAGAVVSGEIHSYRSVLEELNVRVRDRETIDSRLGHANLEREY